MTHLKIYQVSKKGTTDIKKTHYVNADSKTQALKVSKQLSFIVNKAEDVTNSHFSVEERENLPAYVIIASEWIWPSIR
jgi:hypothetical protein